MVGNAVVVNFSGGETSPRSRGRFDQPWYQTSAKKMVNFISELQGPARFRPGFVYSRQTRQGQAARIFDFPLTDLLSYVLEFTPGYLRIYNPITQDALIASTATITGISNASSAAVTVASATGLSNGKEIIISGVVGMPQLNNRQFLIANLSGTTFNIMDPVTGANINTSALPAYVSGGVASVIYEITTPYTSLDLPSIQEASADGFMYVVCPRQAPQKITVDAYGNFSISSFVRTNDPFALGAQTAGITNVQSMWVEDQRLELGGGIGSTLTPGADTGTGVSFTPSNSTTFTVADIGRYIRSFIAQSDTRVGSSATLTPGATTGNSVTFTASSAVFAASDVGSYIRDLANTAGAQGYALITAFTDSTHVTCKIITAFGGTGAIASGSWCIESAGYAKITGFNAGTGVITCTILNSFGSTAALPVGSWAIVTVITIVTLVTSALVNSSLTYTVSGVSGATQINGNSYFFIPYEIAGTIGRFVIRSSSNVDVDSSGWGLYTNGGVITPVSSQPSLNVIGITRGTKTIVSFASGASINPNVAYTFAGVGGTTQINGNSYFLKSESDGIHITLSDGTEIDSTGWSNYTSGGTASAAAENPTAIAFYEGRLFYCGTNQRPDSLFGSRSPDNNGNSRYDDFTGGTADDFAVFFQLAPTGGSTSFISWARGGPDYLFLGTFGGPYRVSGSGLDIPITPSSINVRQFDTAGAEETMSAGLQQMFYIQRNGSTLRSIKVINPYLATFESSDMCLNAEQIGYSPLQRVILQRGRPDALWSFRADGMLAAMSVHLTVQASDTLTGWHRHELGGEGVVVDITAVPRQTGFDQLWAVVQRTINGATRCYVEIMADDVIFPDPEDFFTGNQATDLVAWQNAVWRLQDRYVHMDAEAAYDGSLRGVNAGATLTPSAVGVPQIEGQAPTTITLTASAAVFLASDVGSEIWVKPDPVTGLGAGRALITAFTNSTHVTATVSVPFASTAAVAAGDWYFAVSTFYGFGHLEGQSVAVVADGAVVTDGGQTGDADYPTITVTNGTIVLPQGDLGVGQRAAVLRAGLPYVGMLETHNLEMGGRTGPAQAKPRNIAEINLRFLSTLGAEYGTSLYSLEKIDHRLSDAQFDRPAPVFSGIKRLKLEDSWTGLDDATREKNVFICQRLPLPAIIQFLDLTYDTTDDGGPS